MVNFFKMMGLVVLGVSLAACVTTEESKKVDGQTRVALLANEDIRLSEFYDALLGNLNIKPRFGAAKRPQLPIRDYEAVTFIWARAFAGEFMIRLEFYAEREISSVDGGDFSEPFAVLIVIDRREKQVFESRTSRINHMRTSSERYVVDIPAEEFLLVTGALQDREFDKINTGTPHNHCIDGSAYIIAMELESSSKLTTRHECSKEFSSDSFFAEPLFDLAKEKIPEAKALIDAAWQDINTSQADH